jgi:hypothetical protein
MIGMLCKAASRCAKKPLRTIHDLTVANVKTGENALLKSSFKGINP